MEHFSFFVFKTGHLIAISNERTRRKPQSEMAVHRSISKTNQNPFLTHSLTYARRRSKFSRSSCLAIQMSMDPIGIAIADHLAERSGPISWHRAFGPSSCMLIGCQKDMPLSRALKHCGWAGPDRVAGREPPSRDRAASANALVLSLPLSVCQSFVSFKTRSTTNARGVRTAQQKPNWLLFTDVGNSSHCQGCDPIPHANFTEVHLL